ncbi:right-handed parallel beta-helix repeat-containing protein [Dyadobacter sp. CY347]|uniref:right-handed parallel beta-helix repeat-containing protein n=1 Tax=Dyadobacter sp. CY347 TaxID=2909336 RepID=UPI001F20AE02|nr:right-handed parallel beta-helix repeat-containing protein [Dyadobacter sp. CY347]MCF2490839.1 right-handed parallel beta-helix repeat-containing protein [Dyadobacter sp. CY347]
MKKPYAILLCALLLTLFQSQAYAQLIYLVDGSKTGNATANGVGTVDAAAWGNAVGTIQVAIAASNAGDEIWVRGGTYETISYEPFRLKEGVKYYGHFTGNETQVSQRDMQAESSVTHIVGQEYGTFFGRDLTNATVLDGFKMSRNQNTPEGIGFLLENASPVIRNCLFEQLSSSMSESGVKVENGSPVIDNCVFRSNIATSGGLLYLSGASPTISNSTFERNNGVVVNSNGSAPVYTDCLFTNNNGSSIVSSNNSYSIIRGCKFLNNSNTAVSGAQSSTTLYSCMISGNTSERSPGGIYGNVQSTFTLFDCLIENNTSFQDVGGGIASFATLHLSNCVVTGNKAPQGSGGGIYWNKRDDSENMSLINCVISRNSASTAGGIFGAQLIKNSIVWGNSARLSESNATFIDAPEVVTSIIENGYEGEGQIYINPQFVNPDKTKGNDGIFGTADDGFRLQSCSQAIDAGTNEGITATTDVSGAPRIDNSTIDLGAYEFNGSRTIIPNIIAEGPASFCEGGSVVLRAPEGFGNNYQWNPGGSTDAALTVTSAGSYTVTLTTNEGCVTTSAPFVVTTTTAPAAPLIAGEASREICPDGSTTLALSNQVIENWTEKASFGGAERRQAISFTIGNKGYTGTGVAPDKTNLNDLWEFDPATDSWTQKADFTGSPRSVAAAFAIGGYGYVGTGYDGDQTKDFYQYDPAANAWTQKADFGGSKRYKATGFSIGNKGYIGFGLTPAGYDDDLWEYDPATDSWTEKASIPGGGREAAAAFSVGGAAYAGTGYRNGSILSDFHKYDQATNSWETIAAFAGGERQYAAAFAIGNKGYLGAGISTSGNVGDFWMYDPAANTWNQKLAFPSSETLMSAGFVVNEKAYLPVRTKAFYEYEAGENYTWSNGETTPSITVSTSGTYTVTAANALGCSTTSAAATVTALEYPSENVLVVTQPSCSEATGSITVDPGNAAAAGYTYSIGEGEFQSTADFQDLAPGTYQVNIKNRIGCLTTVSITINAQPEGTNIPVITASGPTAFCVGGQVTLSAPEGYSNYTWNPGGANGSSVTINTTGNYTVTVTNSVGCTATSQPITVTASAFPVIEATVTQPTCAERTGTITASTDQDGSGEILYTLNDGDYRAGNVFTNLAPGTYVIGVMNETGCRSSKEVKINVPEPPITAGGPTAFCTGGNVALSAPEGFASYSWNPGGATSSSITATTQGDYTVTVTDGDGCSITSKPTSIFVGLPVMYVDKNVATPGNGSSWSTAMASFSDAVFLSKQVSCVSEIHVAQGTYHPTSDTNRDSTFTFYRGGLKIFGGYPSGGGTRNSKLNATILSGDLGMQGDTIDNSFHIAVIAGIPAQSDSLVIDGFTFENGVANGPRLGSGFKYNNIEALRNSGAAIMTISNAGFTKLMIRNSTFRSHRASSFGAAIYVLESHASVDNCGFSENVASAGPAILVNTNTNGPVSSMKAVNCTFTANSSTQGGAVYAAGSKLDLVNSVFDSNRTAGAGAALVAAVSQTTVSGCIFYGNSADLYGGAFYTVQGSTKFNGCTMFGNTAAQIGGALIVLSSNVTVENSVIWNNSAPASALIYSSASTSTLNNNIIQETHPGTNNIVADPLFVNAANPAGADNILGTSDDGLRLQPCSPAINAGDQANVPSEIVTDISGASRIFGGNVDMGAFELQSLAQAETLLAANQEFSSKTISGTENTVFNVDGSECKAVIGLEPSGSEPVAGEVTAKVWIETSQPSQFVKRHYEITPAANATSATASVTLYATDAEFNAFNTQSPAPAMLLPLSTDSEQVRAARIANLHIEKRSGSSDNNTGLPDSYESAGVNIDPDDEAIIWNAAAKRWEITFDVTGFSGFFIKTQSSALPVHWVSVDASLNVERQPVITWKVQETDVASYSIHKSLDARRFEVIGKLEGVGDGMHEYRFNEALPLTGTAYYRISQTDIDGTTTYSKIVTLSSEAKADPSSVYPVPARKDVYLIVKKAVQEKETLTLTDLSGRSLKVQKLQTGTNKIDVSNLQMGIYLIRTTGGEVFKIIKE